MYTFKIDMHTYMYIYTHASHTHLHLPFIGCDAERRAYRIGTGYFVCKFVGP